jgi:hypothetical protein
LPLRPSGQAGAIRKQTEKGGRDIIPAPLSTS